MSQTLESALGLDVRDDPHLPVTGGPAGNARLTAWTGLLLLVLSVAEFVTLLDLRGLINWHIAIGVALVPPALLKTLSTGWRIARYYTHNASYRQAGPPPLLLRLLGPGVVATTLGVLGSGLAVVFLGQDHARTALFEIANQHVDWVMIHKALFVAWAVFTGLHVLARLIPAWQLTIAVTAAQRVDGWPLRFGALITTVVASCLGGWLVLSAIAPWNVSGP